jgi:hypothetical protein
MQESKRSGIPENKKAPFGRFSHLSAEKEVSTMLLGEPSEQFSVLMFSTHTIVGISFVPRINN